MMRLKLDNWEDELEPAGAPPGALSPTPHQLGALIALQKKMFGFEEMNLGHSAQLFPNLAP
jgi:hypothetical protein